MAVLRDRNRWLADERVSPDDLTEARLEQFAAARRAGGRRRHLYVTQLAPVLGFLRRAGLAPPLVSPRLVRCAAQRCHHQHGRSGASPRPAGRRVSELAG